MKLAVSNIAWPPQHRDAAYALLRSRGVRGLEIAPALFLSDSADPFAPSDQEVDDVCGAARRAGLELVSMQSLLFGVDGAALFEGPDALSRFVRGMERAIALAGRLSIPNMVFGSPRQRNVPADMTYAEAEASAVPLFRRLGDQALSAETQLGIEFNPAAYGTNFLTDATQALAFVAQVDHPAVTVILDVGAMQMNGHFERIEEFAGGMVRRTSHVHLSEPHLAPAPADPRRAARVFAAMTAAGYNGWYSIEMKAVADDPLSALERSLDNLLRATTGFPTEECAR